MDYTYNITASQSRAARVAGLTLLVLIISGLFSNLYVDPKIIVDADAAQTANNILTHERLFRIGIASTLIMFNCDILQALALYVLLKPVGKNLALLGVFWRFANACIGSFLALNSFTALQLAANTGYLTAINLKQSQALMMLFIDPQTGAGSIELIFFSLGMGVHGYLLFKSKYIPRILSSLYLFAAILLLLSSFALIIFPKIDAVISPAYILPDFVAELLLGLWLSIKGVKPSK